MPSAKPPVNVIRQLLNIFRETKYRNLFSARSGRRDHMSRRNLRGFVVLSKVENAGSHRYDRNDRDGVCQVAVSLINRIEVDQFPGGLAQLGERLHGMQEVRGSSPLSSTRKSRCGNHLERSASEVISIFFRVSSPTVTNSSF